MAARDARSANPAIAVLGAGSWGTALAVLAAKNGFPTLLWGHDPARMAQLAHARENARYLPGVRFPDALQIREDLIAAAQEAKHLLLVVPSHAFRATLEAVRPYLAPDAIIAWATKGLEPATGRTLDQVAIELLDGKRGFGVVSGPTFAREVAQGLPTAVTVAAESPEIAEAIAGWLRSDRVRVYTSNDLVGVELGGAIKNVMAIATGISDGLGLGANARAARITRGLAEMQRLIVAMGGRPETVLGLAGIGDLVLTRKVLRPLAKSGGWPADIRSRCRLPSRFAGYCLTGSPRRRQWKPCSVASRATKPELDGQGCCPSPGRSMANHRHGKPQSP